MKKQVTFAESRKIRRLYQDDTRTAETIETKGALKDACMNFNSGVKANRHGATIQIPQTMTAAPFLKHAALTPAQKEYLYTIAASYSTAHVRDLITQHYMNVLHRCIPTGSKPDRDHLDVTSVTLPTTDVSVKPRLEVPARPKQEKKINAGARITLLEDEDEEEEKLNDSLSDCLSSLSMGEWDDDTFSDL
ncbi:Protein FAM216A [Collichthys lucidus]|uniref:Protein FAM216A n=1 Tax=Collichthys lucidus TaxID=240159 RepID=A0A4V6AUW9_COLLU|nr:Protein FAM216A [Collichthys lucidus]